MLTRKRKILHDLAKVEDEIAAHKREVERLELLKQTASVNPDDDRLNKIATETGYSIFTSHSTDYALSERLKHKWEKTFAYGALGNFKCEIEEHNEMCAAYAWFEPGYPMFAITTGEKGPTSVWVFDVRSGNLLSKITVPSDPRDKDRVFHIRDNATEPMSGPIAFVFEGSYKLVTVTNSTVDMAKHHSNLAIIGLRFYGISSDK